MVAVLLALALGTCCGFGVGALLERERSQRARLRLIEDLFPEGTAIERAMREDADAWARAAAELGMDREGRIRDHQQRRG